MIERTLGGRMRIDLQAEVTRPIEVLLDPKETIAGVLLYVIMPEMDGDAVLVDVDSPQALEDLGG